ncbi:MAG TPA: DUF3455 domain-containing protein [Polyangiaceae bacterium]|nr:DUF3455 domain-containing protein [Polyangiaceae bacterium]
MKTTMTTFRALTALSLPLTLTIAGCGGTGGENGKDRESGPPANDAMIEVTIVGYDKDGQEIVETTQITKEEQQAIHQDRKRRMELAAEGIAESTQELVVTQNASGCYSTGLLLYSQANLTGNLLCLRVVGHEGGGTATLNLPASWIKANGGNFPQSFWAGTDGGRFFSYGYGTYGFAPWANQNSAPAVQAAHALEMDRLLTAPGVDPSLQPPAGEILVHEMRAKGHQIYVCREKSGSPGVFEWTFSAPSAILTDPHVPGDLLGFHYVGPTWQSSDDGSTVKGTVVAKVNSATPGAIPWLRLQATSNTGTGVFSTISSIQRVNTWGGAAPATGCDATTFNSTIFVDYTADYFFYATPQVPSSWTCSPSYYNAMDGCDCNCGAPDPDCVKADQNLYWCGAGQICNVSGVCSTP